MWLMEEKLIVGGDVVYGTCNKVHWWGWSKWSVYSAQRVRCANCLDLIALKRHHLRSILGRAPRVSCDYCWILPMKVVAFFDFMCCTNCHDVNTYILRRSFDAAGWVVIIHFDILTTMMVLIDRAWEDDSNGGHNVKFDGFDLSFEILDPEPDLAELYSCSLDLFLTETICIRSSNQAHYTSNR